MMPALENHWYAAAGSYRLKEAPLGVKVLNQSVVLFRDGTGQPVALRDRCAHRGFPLNTGEVKDGQLRCPLHGWTYDGSGRCSHIPAEGSRLSEPGPRIQRFGCVEKNGFVWVDLSSSLSTPPPAARDLGRGWLQGMTSIEASALLTLEHTIDLTHISFAHLSHPMAQAFRNNGMVAATGTIRPNASGFSVEWRIGNRQAYVTAVFELPGTIRFEIPSTGGTREFIFHTIPEGEDRCRIEWAATDPSSLHEGARFVEGACVIEEDKSLLEKLSNTRLEDGYVTETHRESDLPALLIREMLTSKREWNFQETIETWLPGLTYVKTEPLAPDADPHLRLIHAMME